MLPPWVISNSGPVLADTSLDLTEKLKPPLALVITGALLAAISTRAPPSSKRYNRTSAPSIGLFTTLPLIVDKDRRSCSDVELLPPQPAERPSTKRSMPEERDRSFDIEGYLELHTGCMRW